MVDDNEHIKKVQRRVMLLVVDNVFLPLWVLVIYLLWLSSCFQRSWR